MGDALEYLMNVLSGLENGEYDLDNPEDCKIITEAIQNFADEAELALIVPTK